MIGLVVKTDDGPKYVCTIDRLKRVVRLAPMDWRPDQEPDPRKGPQIPFKALRI